MAQITLGERESTITSIHDRLREAKRQIREEAAKGLVGRTVSIQRTLKDPISGDWHDPVLEATVTGLAWSYDDDMLMTVEYTHPFTGKVMKTEEGL